MYRILTNTIVITSQKNYNGDCRYAFYKPLNTGCTLNYILEQTL